MANRLAIALIDFYRKLLSPLMPQACRFHPSCSSYARQAYVRHGFWVGSALTVCRIIKCHPYNPGGHDPVPDQPPRIFRKPLMGQDSR